MIFTYSFIQICVCWFGTLMLNISSIVKASKRLDKYCGYYECNMVCPTCRHIAHTNFKIDSSKIKENQKKNL